MAAQSPLFAKVETFQIWLFQHTRKFPRDERLRLAKRLDDSIFELHRCLVYAIKTGDMEYLKKADAELTLLRFYLKLSVELRYTSIEQYAFTAENATEIGRMLGAWLRKAFPNAKRQAERS